MRVTPKLRFYDKDQLLSTTVDMISRFPADLQGIIAKGLNLIAIKDFQVDKRMDNLKSYGPETILPLYKSKQKMRRYDDNMDFHKAINYLRLLNPQERQQVALKVIDIAQLTEQVLVADVDVSPEDRNQCASQIRDTYITTGAEAARQFVAAVCEELTLQRRRRTGIDAGSKLKADRNSL